MLTIRLQRTGKKNQADFRIVLAEKEAPVKKKVEEVLGSYNPRKKYFQVKEERLKYWLGQRVQASPTVHNLLVAKGLMEGPKVKAFSTPKKETEATAAVPAQTPAESPAPQAEAPAAESPAPEKPAETPASEASPVPEQPAS
ncbi:MAG: 30S ribosomal protein S16 [Patescibacteria group bacterium]|nr:30S ribosomal protein S16 [Patescibacteria group bacterium]